MLRRSLQMMRCETAELHRIALAVASCCNLPDLLHAIVESAAMLLKAKAALLLVEDGGHYPIAASHWKDGQDALALQEGESVARAVVARGKAIVVDKGDCSRSDIPFGVDNALAVPLKWQERTIGVFTVLHEANSRRFTDHEVGIVERFATLAVLGIEKARIAQEAAAAQSSRQTAKQQSEFLAMVLHELRPPLGLIRGYTAALTRKDISLTDEQRAAFFGRLSEATSMLNWFARDILTITQMESGQFRLNKVAFDISSTIKNMVEHYRGVTRSCWRFAIDVPDLLLVEADDTQIERVLRNLLDNAMKFSAPGTEIRVCGSVAEGASPRVVVEVRDEGIGIPQDDAERLFEKCFQGKYPLGKRQQGSGLGLYICRQIIHEHGGVMWGRNNPDRGASFGFEIPLGGEA